jgi:hypothetical protein
VAIFKRRQTSSPGTTPSAAVRGTFNLLPADNIYLKAILPVNDEYHALGWTVRVVALRMLYSSELEVAFVVPGTERNSNLREVLEALPGPEQVLGLVEKRAKMFGHTLIPRYFNEYMWRAESPAWEYYGV